MFFRSGYGEKTKHYIFGKNGRSPNALFSRKYRFPFRSETEKRTSGASGTASGGRTPAKAVGRSKAKAGKAAAETERSERKAEGGERSETTEPNRARGASEQLPTKSSDQQLGRREVQSLCSLFAFLGGSMHPIGEETEKRRNGTEAAPLFCLSFVHEYGDYF